MSTSKAHIIAQLQREILSLQGYKPAADGQVFDGGLGSIRHAFPNASFPLAAMHEFICDTPEEGAATAGFISGVVSGLVKNTGVLLWISAHQNIFPPALQLFGIQPENIVFVGIKKEKERLWAIEEALKCEALSAVIGEVQEVSFTCSRRFQLAVEHSKVTGFIIRRNPKNMASAAVARWKIVPLPSKTEEGLPGVGFPRWNVELQKVRNGKPGTWQLEWAAGAFRQVYTVAIMEQVAQRKAG